MSDVAQVLSPGSVPDSVVQALINELKDQASRMNAAVAAFYQAAVQKAEDAKSRGFQAAAPPQLELYVVNEWYVRAAEQGQLPAGAPDQTWLKVPYLPPPPTPTLPKPLVGDPDPFLPGYFQSGPGDGGQILANFVTHQDGKAYRKVVISHNPFAANGDVCRWVEVSA